MNSCIVRADQWEISESGGHVLARNLRVAHSSTTLPLCALGLLSLHFALLPQFLSLFYHLPAHSSLGPRCVSACANRPSLLPKPHLRHIRGRKLPANARIVSTGVSGHDLAVEVYPSECDVRHVRLGAAMYITRAAREARRNKKIMCGTLSWVILRLSHILDDALYALLEFITCRSFGDRFT